MNAEISNLWRLVDPQSPVIELSAISEWRSRSMLFPLRDYATQESRQEEVEQVAQRLNEGGMNIYVVMNTIREDFYSGSVKDADIEHRDWSVSHERL